MNEGCLEFSCHLHLLQNITTENGINFTQEPICIKMTLNSSDANNKIMIIMIATSDKDLWWLPSLLSCNLPQIQTGLYFKLCRV